VSFSVSIGAQPERYLRTYQYKQPECGEAAARCRYISDFLSCRSPPAIVIVKPEILVRKGRKEEYQPAIELKFIYCCNGLSKTRQASFIMILLLHYWCSSSSQTGCLLSTHDSRNTRDGASGLAGLSTRQHFPYLASHFVRSRARVHPLLEHQDQAQAQVVMHRKDDHDAIALNIGLP